MHKGFPSYHLCNIANIKVRILISDKVSERISHELRAKKILKEGTSDITISVNDGLYFENYEPKIHSAKGSMNFDDNQILVDYNDEFKYIFKNLAEGDSEIAIDTNKKSLKKFFKGCVIGKLKLEVDAFLSYSLFWYATHLKLLQKNCSYLHAGIVDKNGKAIVLAGTGGCGKTSTMFKILEDDRFNYLAEDFGIIDDDGNAHFSPKPITVYNSDLRFGQKLLNGFIKKLPLKEKVIRQFKIKVLKLNPMIKVSPNDIFKNRITKIAPISYVVYIVRGKFSNIEIKDIELKNLVDRVTKASIRELKVFNELTLLINANAPSEYNYPTFEEITKKTKDVYTSGMKSVNKKIMYVPVKASPKEVVDFLTSEGIF